MKTYETRLCYFLLSIFALVALASCDVGDLEEEDDDGSSGVSYSDIMGFYKNSQETTFMWAYTKDLTLGVEKYGNDNFRLFKPSIDLSDTKTLSGNMRVIEGDDSYRVSVTGTYQKGRSINMVSRLGTYNLSIVSDEEIEKRLTDIAADWSADAAKLRIEANGRISEFEQAVEGCSMNGRVQDSASGSKGIFRIDLNIAGESCDYSGNYNGLASVFYDESRNKKLLLVTFELSGDGIKGQFYEFSLTSSGS